MSDDQGEIRPTRIYPITFCQQGKLQAIPAPLVRLSLCGLIEVEVLTEVLSSDPPQGRYEVLSPRTLRGRGAVPALMLLKVLASCPQRFATCDWLSEQMGREMDAGALVRLDTIASALRSVLCRLKAEEELSVDALRRLLVTYLRNGRSSGPGYQLAPYPFIWVDSDALGDSVEHGALMERMGEPTLALPFWQRSFELGSRGEYLCDEPHSEWARAKREQVAGHLRQSVHALHRLLLAQQGDSAREEIILFLRAYWQTHKTDEDVLRPLMELLGEQERFGEADAYYQQCVAALEQEEAGREPASQTRDVHAFLRLKHLSRSSRPTLSSSLQDVHLHDSLPSLFTPMIQSYKMLPAAFSTRTIMRQESLVFPAYGVLVPSPTSLPMQSGTAEGGDWATWFGLKLAQLLTYVDYPRGQLHLCLALQEELNQELNVMKPNPQNETYMLSRRQALVTLAALPSALLLPFQQGQWLPWHIERFLSRCTGSLTACWHLLRGNEFTAVEDVIPQYLPVLLTILQQSSAYRQPAAHLATQCHLLMSLVVRHRGIMQSTQSEVWHCHQAVLYSDIAGDDALAVAALKQQADTFYYNQCHVDMRKSYEKAHHLIDITEKPDEIPPLLRCRIYAGLADAYAKDDQAEVAQHYLKLLRDTFPACLTDDRLPLYADCGVHSLYLWEGLTLLDFGDGSNQQSHYRQASIVFAKIEQFPTTLIIPERTRLEIVTHQAATAVRLGDMDQFRVAIEKGAEGVKKLGSQKRRRELIAVYTQGTHLWPHEATVQSLADVLVS